MPGTTDAHVVTVHPLSDGEKEYLRVQAALLAQQRRDVDRIRLDNIIRRFGGKK